MAGADPSEASLGEEALLLMTIYPYLTWPTTTVRSWDDGIAYRHTVVSVDETFLALPVVYVAEKIIRTKTDGYDDDLIESYIRAATELAEHETQTTIRPSRLGLITSGMPWGGFELGRPVREMVSIDYYDGDDAVQTLSGSPAPWILVPSGVDSPALLYPAAGASWPSAYTRPDAVTVTYDAGYALAQDIPQMLRIGIGLIAAELYKNPDLSNDMGMVSNILHRSSFLVRKW